MYSGKRSLLGAASFASGLLGFLFYATYFSAPPLRLMSSGGVVIYVSLTGSDANDGSKASPLATPHKAQQLLRQAGGGIAYFAVGTYYLPEMLTLTASDNNSVYATLPEDAAKGTLATFSGGVPISNWSTEAGRLVADLPEDLGVFNQLWVDKERATRARSPNIGSDAESWGYVSSTLRYASDIGGPGFVYADDDIKEEWAGTNVTILVFGAWKAQWYSVASVTPANKTVIFKEAFDVEQRHGGQRYLLENLPEFLDAPGEWHADFDLRKLSYIPVSESENSPPLAVAPKLNTAISIKGASGVTLANLTIAHGRDAGNRKSAYYATHGLLQIHNAEDVVIEGSKIQNCGGSGIYVRGGVRGLHIRQTHVTDTGGTGIMFSDKDVEDVVIEDSVVTDTGRIFLKQPSGIHLRGRSNIVLRHSEIGRGPYAGVMVGWQSGSPTGLPAPDIFDVAFNHVHDFGMGILSDFAGIMLSSGDNTCFQEGHAGCAVRAVIRQNLIHTGRHFDHGASGVYMDEQSARVWIEKNTIYDIDDAGVYFHCGTNNTAINNVIHVKGSLNLVKSCNQGGNPTYPNLPRGFTWHRNIGYMEGGDIVASDKDYTNTTFTQNWYWSDTHVGTCCAWPGGTSWSTWHDELGHEKGSVANKDPLFVHPSQGDYRLSDGSQAPSLIGWETIDYGSIGPRTSKRLPSKFTLMPADKDSNQSEFTTAVTV